MLLVIGGGLAGVGTAFWLNQRGLACVLLEGHSYSPDNFCRMFTWRQVFDDAMEFEIDEYEAPSLAEQARLARRASQGDTSPRRAKGALSRQASTSELSRQQSDGMDKLIIARLREWIVQSRDDLQYYFERKDPRDTGLTSPAVWREGLTAVLSLTAIPLVQYQAKLVSLEPDGRSIDYRRFLQRYVLVQDAAESGWQHDVVRVLYEGIVRQDLPLRDTYALLDPHNSGRVTAAAFKQACQDCDAAIEITSAQAAELLNEIDSSSTMGVRRSASGGVDLKKFIERLHTVYVSATGGHPLCDDLTPEQARWVRPLLRRIGRAIAGGASVVDVFEQFDTERRGYLSHSQFVDAIGTVDRGPDGSGTVTERQLEELARLVDVNSNGRITIWEFCEAFVSAEDTASVGGAANADGLRRQFSNAIVASVAGFIYTNRAILRRTWQDGDPELDGLVTVQEFQAGLHHVNLVLHSPLKRSQLEALVDHAGRRAEAAVREGRRRARMIDYERFLESFDLVDLEAADSDSVLGPPLRPPLRAGSSPSSEGRGSPSPPRGNRRSPPEGRTPSRAVRLKTMS